MLVDKLQPFLDRYDEISRILSHPDTANNISTITSLSKEQSSLEEIYLASKKYIKIIEDIEENKLLVFDKEFGELAKEELKILEEQKVRVEEDIKILLLPKDPNDDKNVFLEIRAGTGGDEAALFAGDLFSAYIRYADLRGYKYEVISQSEGSVGGFKEIIILIKGKGAFSRLKFEGGIHRVQRIPQTESQGRVHTSAITVAVMPEVEESKVQINDNDIEVQVMRSSGHGGQSVNTTDSAVRIIHKPTGLVVVNQDGKNQHKNKEAAMKVLVARLYDLQEQEKMKKEREQRSEQVGSGDRSGRIRTYNYPQNRISDHRINLTLYRLDAIMSSGFFDEIIDPLIAHYQAIAMNNSGL